MRKCYNYHMSSLSVPAEFTLHRKNKYDLSISRYKPVEHKTVQYEKPEALMDKVLILEEEIVEFVRTIKKSV